MSVVDGIIDHGSFGGNVTIADVFAECLLNFASICYRIGFTDLSFGWCVCTLSMQRLGCGYVG